MNPIVAAALALAGPFNNPFRFATGALGGARGHNPFPAPRAYKAHGARHIPEPITHRLVINDQPQPWQKHAAKLKARAIALHLDPNARRIAREARNAELAAARVTAERWSGKAA